MMIQQAPPPGGEIVLGRQGENEARQIVFRVSDWVKVYGEGVVILLHQRRGDRKPYPVAIAQEGTTITWTVSSVDTAKTGIGKAELQYIVGNARIKSAVYRTITKEALGTNKPQPDAYETWLDTLTSLAAETQTNAEAAAESEANAKKYAELASEGAGGLSNVTFCEELPEAGSEDTLYIVTAEPAAYIWDADSAKFEALAGEIEIRVASDEEVSEAMDDAFSESSGDADAFGV